MISNSLFTHSSHHCLNKLPLKPYYMVKMVAHYSRCTSKHCTSHLQQRISFFHKAYLNIYAQQVDYKKHFVGAMGFLHFKMTFKSYFQTL